MPDSPTIRDRDDTTLSAGQRDWIRREGRVARALEAAQRRSGRRFASKRRQAPARERRAPADQTPRAFEPPRLSGAARLQGPPFRGLRR